MASVSSSMANGYADKSGEKNDSQSQTTERRSSTLSSSGSSLTASKAGGPEILQPFPAGRRREFLTFFKSLRSVPHDLSNFSAGAPPFVFTTISVVEYPVYLAEQTELFTAPLALSNEDQAEQRAMAVMKWYVCALAGQFGVRRRTPGVGSGRKPLNPILGEAFRGWFHVDDAAGSSSGDGKGRIELLTEQISHQPPVTAYHLSYAPTPHSTKGVGMVLEGWFWLHTNFRRGTIWIERTGLSMLAFDLAPGRRETYSLEFPKMYLAGLLPSFSPYPEAEGICKIVGSNGYVCELEFKGKGWFGGGSKNSIKAKLTRTADSAVVARVEGQWSGGELAIMHEDGSVLERFNTSRHNRNATLQMRPTEEQDKMESRRVWSKVADALERGDMAAVSREKGKIEEEERRLRREEKASGKEWQIRFFESREDWPEAEAVEKTRLSGKAVDREETGQIWRRREGV